MTDYIERDIERIIANAQECDIDALTWEEQKERLKTVKSADVAPVVRCKDCVSFHYSGMGGDDGITYCAKGIEMQPTDFCSYGERREK